MVWARFPSFSSGKFACILTSKSIWLLSLSGISHCKALPIKIASIWPINGDGVLLVVGALIWCQPHFYFQLLNANKNLGLSTLCDFQGNDAIEAFVLQHPFQPLARRTFNGSTIKKFDARKIVWSGLEQNILATHYLVRSSCNAIPNNTLTIVRTSFTCAGEWIPVSMEVWQV